MRDYTPFDYFSTPSGEFWDNKEKMKEYGLTEMQVIEFKKIMEEDKKRWVEKQRSIESWKIIFLLISTFLVITLVANNWRKFNDSIILSYLCFFGTGGLIYWVWSDYGIGGLFNWLVQYNKRKSQNNILIEKYLEDCHWEWYRTFLKPYIDKEEKNKKK